MEKTRKLSLKRKRNVDKKQTDAKKKCLANNIAFEDGGNSIKNASEKDPILRQDVNFILPTVDPSTWQEIPSLPPWTPLQQTKEDGFDDKDSGVDIQVTKDVKIRWTPLPPFCKQCLIRGIPKGKRKPVKKTGTREQLTETCITKQELNTKHVSPDRTCSKSKNADQLSSNLSKAKLAPKTSFNQPGAIRLSDSTISSVLPGRDTQDIHRSIHSSTTFQQVSRKSTSAVDVTSRQSSESSSSESEKSTSFKSSSKTIEKKFVPFSASKTAKPTNAALHSKPNPPSGSSLFGASTSKQTSVLQHAGGTKSVQQAGGTKSAQGLSSKEQRVLPDVQVTNSNYPKEIVPKEAPASVSAPASAPVSDDDPLGGLTDEDLIVILSSDDEDEQVFPIVKPPAAATKNSWKQPSKNIGSKDSKKSSSQEQKGRSKQSKASQKNKGASKAPSRTIFDYAKAMPSSNQIRFGKSEVQSSNQRISKPQSATGSGKSSHGQSSSGNRTEDKIGEESGLQSCPLCQLTFKAGWNQVQIDGHIAACLAESSDDVMW
ncbi:uncharacterized protein [Amphiura filiformis]|uniref:uncharacterized protein n=1 Tax=Amphiura filiformis TaxID=82378 RepID=UPI003B22264F